MDYITDNGKEYILISNKSHLDELINLFTRRELIANRFKFSERDLFIFLLEALKITYEEFTKKYFYYDRGRKIHISESEFGYIWISTYGLIPQNKVTTNRAVNSCINQHTVLKLLFEKSIEIAEDEKVYDIDSYNFGYLSELSPAIYHNLIFYVEVFCKAYLSLTGIEAPHTHKLSLIYQKTVETMISRNHNDSLFQALILDPLYKLVDHIRGIPGNFKEQFVKYDDNPMDDSVIIFELEGLHEMINVLELSCDFISDYFYNGADTHYLRSGLYRRLMDKAETEEEKKKIQKMYSHLAANK